MVEVGSDVEMMRLEYSFERSDWSIVRLLSSVFLRVFIAQNMGNFGSREIAIILLAYAYAHATLFSIGDIMPAIALKMICIKPSIRRQLRRTVCLHLHKRMVVTGCMALYVRHG
jgi:deoxyribodipyrimidine photolyase-like uncharacterized protein